jgi:hypothetical protein
MLQLILISVLLVGLAIGGIAIKMFLKKGGEFQKSCGSVDPESGQRIACTCGKPSDEVCDNKKQHYTQVDLEKTTAR